MKLVSKFENRNLGVLVVREWADPLASPPCRARRASAGQRCRTPRRPSREWSRRGIELNEKKMLEKAFENSLPNLQLISRYRFTLAMSSVSLSTTSRSTDFW